MGEAFRKAKTPGAIISETDQQAADALEKRPTAIGISALSLILAEKRPFKMIPLNGVTPSVETLKSGQYPLSKSLYMITKTPKTKDVQAFVKFIQSSEGRKILWQTGHILDN
jgi:phosphate transport system substrate-binding protein